MLGARPYFRAKPESGTRIRSKDSEQRHAADILKQFTPVPKLVNDHTSQSGRDDKDHRTRSACACRQNVDWDTQQEPADGRNNHCDDDHDRRSEHYLDERVFLCRGEETIQRIANS